MINSFLVKFLMFASYIYVCVCVFCLRVLVCVFTCMCVCRGVERKEVLLPSLLVFYLMAGHSALQLLNSLLQIIMV